MHRAIDKMMHDRVRAIVIVPAWHHRHWLSRLKYITKAAYRLPLQALNIRHASEVWLPRVFQHLVCFVDGELLPFKHTSGTVWDPDTPQTAPPLSHVVNSIVGCTLYDNDRECAKAIVSWLRNDTQADNGVRHISDLSSYQPDPRLPSLEADDFTDIEYSSLESDMCFLTSSESSHSHTEQHDFVVHLQVMRLSDQGTLPRKGSEGSAGLDISAARSIVVPAGGQVVLATDLAFAFRTHTYGKLATRSGLAARTEFMSWVVSLIMTIVENAGVIHSFFSTPWGS